MKGDGSTDDRDDVVAPLARYFLWADSPGAVWRVIQGLGALCALLFAFDLVWHRHAYVPGEGLWGFHAIAGFVSFTAIVLGAKALRTVIGRREDYYAPAAIDAEAYPESGLGRLAATDGEDAADLLLVRDGEVVGERAPDAGAVGGGERGGPDDGAGARARGAASDGGRGQARGGRSGAATGDDSASGRRASGGKTSGGKASGGKAGSGRASGGKASGGTASGGTAGSGTAGSGTAGGGKTSGGKSSGSKSGSGKANDGKSGKKGGSSGRKAKGRRGKRGKGRS